MPKPTEIQTLILSKDRFKSLDAAKKWCKSHDFKTEVDETKDSYRFRQREPGKYDEGSFHTIELDDGVKAVIGHLKTAKPMSTMGLIGSTAHVPGPIKVVMAPVLMRVEKRGAKWVVTTEDGSRVLGTHDTKEEALAQLAAIEASKARAAAKHETMARHIGKSVRFSAVLGDDGKVRVGLWDRGETFGTKPKDEIKTVFSVETFNQFIDNWLARGEPLSVCYNHQTAYVKENGAPAPALAYHNAVAMVKDGKLLRYEKLNKSIAQPPDIAELTLAVKTFATDDDPNPSPDGLWWYRSEVTPFGQELLPNYKFLSPMFVPDGEDEYGEQIGYTIYDHAATNTAFQAGCMIQFEATGKPKIASLFDCATCGQRLADVAFDDRLPNHVGRDGLPCDGSEKEPSKPSTIEGLGTQVTQSSTQGAMGTAKKGGPAMARKFEESTRKRIGFEEGADDASIMQAFGKRCMESVKKFEEDTRKILEEEDAEEGVAVKDPVKMEARKVARMESVKKFEEEAKALDEDSKAYKEGFKEEPDEEEKPHIVMRRLARAYARFAKMARMDETVEPKPVGMEEEEEAKKQLAQRFEIDSKAITFSRVLTHINAKLTGAEQVAMLQQKINLLEQKDTERETANKRAKAQLFARTAIEQFRTTEDKKDLIEKVYVDQGEPEAERLLFAKETFAALRQYTSNGNPPGHNPNPTKFIGATGGRERVEFDRAVRETMAADKVDYGKAMEIVFKKDPSLYER